MKNINWYRLDNVGKFYASLANNQIPNIFRFSVTLNTPVDETLLDESLKETVAIFPEFNVNLKKGLFWYYLEESSIIPKVSVENLPICYKLYNNSDDVLYRVNYYKNRINFEVSHIISDGRGSSEFFKYLISCYVKKAYKLKKTLPINSSSAVEKSEDSFHKYYKPVKTSHKNKEKNYLYKNSKLKNQTLFMEVHMSVKELLNLAHKSNATMTSFLVSILIYSFLDEMKLSDLDKSIKIDVPVDLRGYFKSSSSKNFFGLTTISYQFKSKNDQLSDIIASVNQQFEKKITKQNLSERMNKMIAFEKNIFCRVVPIFIKNFALKHINNITANMSTTCLSNVGKIDFPEGVDKYIEEVNVLTSTNSFQFTICSFKDKLSIGISSRYKNNNVIKNFCRYFSAQGLDVKINVNEVDL